MVTDLFVKGVISHLPRIRNLRRMSGPSFASLSVIPAEALIDQPVRISVTGLLPNQSVTLHARLVEKNIRMASCGHFSATNEGSLDLTHHPSLSGSYTGVEPMGLFWSMKFEPDVRKGSRLMKKDVTTPYTVTISVIDGHVSWDDLCKQSFSSLCQQHVLRWYKGKDVERREIRHGNIRGTMFIPPGPGPHRGVIDIFGTIGGLLEYKASLLASRGFTTLALAWFDFEDLPKSLEDVDLNYFYEAVDWFKSQPEVCSSGIGVMSVSKGSDFALVLALTRPEVKAVVSIGGTPFIMFNDMKFGGVYLRSAPMNLDPKLEKTDEGIIVRDSFLLDDASLFDYSKIHGHVLFVGGDDDGSLRPGMHDPALVKLTPAQRSKFTSLLYPRTGHLIEPPYTAVTVSTFHKTAGFHIRWGGDIPYHAKAQEDSWKRIIEFFTVHIPLTPAKAML